MGTSSYFKGNGLLLRLKIDVSVKEKKKNTPRAAFIFIFLVAITKINELASCKSQFA